MSVIMTFMFEPAKLQMNWAKASGASIFRSDALVGCPVLTMLSTVAYLPVGRITRHEWGPIFPPVTAAGRRSGRVGGVADDWRLTVTFRDEADVEQAVQSVREHEVEDDVRSRLGHRVAMSVDGPVVFLYAGTEDAAREADRLVREVLARHQLSAEFTLDRWHPLEEEWEDASVPMPDTAEQQAAEHRHLMDAETQQSLAAGQAGWEVRVELPSHRQAVALAERLEAEGRPVIRRWKYLVLGANNEDDASALAEALRQEVSAKASVHTLAVPIVQFDASKPGT
jgi:hypothetical protein